MSASRSPNVALILDHPQRDLAGIVLTAFELCQRGAVCHLVPHNLENREIWALAPDFVLLNYFRIGNADLARKLALTGIEFGVLDTEGTVWPNETSYTDLLWRDASLRQLLKCVCMWGPRLAEWVVTHGFLNADQVFVTGCPRFDFYHPDWQPILSAGGDHPRGHILINTNFSLGNPRFATADQNAREVRGLGFSQASIDAWVEAERQAIHGMIALARDLARDFPDRTVVLRPHPFEKSDRYRHALRGAESIIVDNGRPVQPEICGAAVVVQRSCSTAVEAGLAGVPTISPQWIPAPVVIPIAERVSVPCASYAELRSIVDEIVSGRYESPPTVRCAIDAVTRDWFYRPDGLAYKRVSDTVMSALSGARAVDDALCERFLYGVEGSLPRHPRDVGRLLRFRLGLGVDWSFFKMRRVPVRNKPGKVFNASLVGDLSERIRQAIRNHGRNPRPVRVTTAVESGDYRHRFDGATVTMVCDE